MLSMHFYQYTMWHFLLLPTQHDWSRWKQGSEMRTRHEMWGTKREIKCKCNPIVQNGQRTCPFNKSIRLFCINKQHWTLQNCKEEQVYYTSTLKPILKWAPRRVGAETKAEYCISNRYIATEVNLCCTSIKPFGDYSGVEWWIANGFGSVDDGDGTTVKNHTVMYCMDALRSKSEWADLCIQSTRTLSTIPIALLNFCLLFILPHIDID